MTTNTPIVEAAQTVAAVAALLEALMLIGMAVYAIAKSPFSTWPKHEVAAFVGAAAVLLIGTVAAATVASL